jgi:hypothetical protein
MTEKHLSILVLRIIALIFLALPQSHAQARELKIIFSLETNVGEWLETVGYLPCVEPL